MLISESVRLSKIARAATLLFGLPVDRSVGFSGSLSTGNQGDYEYRMPKERIMFYVLGICLFVPMSFVQRLSSYHDTRVSRQSECLEVGKDIYLLEHKVPSYLIH